MQNKIKRIPFLASIVIILCTQANVSQADPNTLVPGGFLFPLSAGPGPSTGATLLYSTNVAWGPSLSFSGDLISSVWQGDTNNPYDGLTFTYQLLITASSTNGVGELAIGDFAGFSNIDVTYDSLSSGQPPNAVGRSSTSIDNGADINFFYFSELPPGNQTPLLVVQTGASDWQNSLASIIDMSAYPDVPTLSPRPVPEPTTINLLAIACLVATTIFRRSSRPKLFEVKK